MHDQEHSFDGQPGRASWGGKRHGVRVSVSPPEEVRRVAVAKIVQDRAPIHN
jgi:hypothetical protein